MKQSQKLLKSKLLDKFPLIYGFTTKLAGDFRYNNIKKLGKLFNIAPKNIITMSQVHGRDILEINSDSSGVTNRTKRDLALPRCHDGMLTNLKNKFLVVKTADCVPILFYDPVKKIVAVCHAGWRGTFEKIGEKIIQKMQKFGSKPENIITVLGPHIGPCCYNVPEQRAKLFNNFVNKNNKYYLDLGKENTELLKKAGVKQIEDVNICTSCQNELLFSYRKQGPTHGEQVGLIGMI